MVEPNHDNNKISFDKLDENVQTFEEENEEFAGKDVTLRFIVKDTKEDFTENFKEGQDWEFVKYKISSKLCVEPENINLYNGENIIIPLFSICDIPLEEDGFVTVEVISGNE